MPPKKNRPKPFSWAGGKGQLTDVAKGIVFGLHLCGTSAPDIAVLMQITKKSAYDTIRATAESIGAEHSLPQKAQEDAEEEGEDDTPRPSARDSMSPHQEKMLARKEKIEEWMDEKDEEGHYVMKTARDLRKRFREAEEEDNLVGLRTIQRDLKELNILWKAMPVSAGLKQDVHKRVTCFSSLCLPTRNKSNTEWVTRPTGALSTGQNCTSQKWERLRRCSFFASHLVSLEAKQPRPALSSPTQDVQARSM